MTHRETSPIASLYCAIAVGLAAVLVVAATGPIGALTVGASFIPVVLACALAMVVGRFLRLKLRTALSWCAAGAAIAAPVAGVFSLGTLPFGLSELAGAVIVAPLVEELVKVGVARRFVPAKSRVMVVAAAACVAGGFAALEDVLYLVSSEPGMYLSTLVARCVFSPLVHVAFTVVAVLGWHRGALLRWTCLVGGVLLHASWNLTASTEATAGAFVVVVVAYSAIPFVVVMSLWEGQRSTLRRDPRLFVFGVMPRSLVLSFDERVWLRRLPPSARAEARVWAEIKAAESLQEPFDAPSATQWMPAPHRL